MLTTAPSALPHACTLCYTNCIRALHCLAGSSTLKRRSTRIQHAHMHRDNVKALHLCIASPRTRLTLSVQACLTCHNATSLPGRSLHQAHDLGSLIALVPGCVMLTRPCHGPAIYTLDYPFARHTALPVWMPAMHAYRLASGPFTLSHPS